MKKVFKNLLVVSLLLVLCSCGGSKNNLDMSGAETALDEKFTNMNKIEDSELEVIYDVDTSLFEDYVIKYSSKSNGDFYALIKVKSDKKTEAQNAMNHMLKVMADQSNLYSPEAVSLINNHLETTVGNYLIYIVSNDNNSYYDILKGYIN